MFFISTPSLIISSVLVVFYLANLVFFVANRQKETENSVEFVDSRPENNRYLQHTVFIQFKDHSLQYKSQNDTRTVDQYMEHFDAVIAANRNIYRQTLHDIPLIFNPGISWKPFSRPPPCKRLCDIRS